MKRLPQCVTSKHLSAFCAECRTRVQAELHIFTHQPGTPDENQKFYCRKCCPHHGQPLLKNIQVLGSPVGADSKHRSARGSR